MYLRIVLLAVLLVGACGDVRELEITDENKDSLLEKIKDTSDLSVEEVQLLQGYILRKGMREALSGGDPSLPVGKRIGELIEEQRKYVEDEKIRQEEERRKREVAKAEEERQRKVLLDALDVTVYETGFQNRSYQDYITFKVSFENKLEQDIRAFEGSVAFKDLFDDLIQHINLKEDDPLAAGETRQESYTLEYNQFIDSHQKLKSTKLENMKTEWLPKTILLTDGIALRVESDGSE